MEIIQELGQLDYGGVERVVRNIIKYDKENTYKVVAYKDGAYRKELEKVGAKIIVLGMDEVDLSADIIHVHSGGARSNMASQLYKDFPIIETIHSPVRSAVRNHEVAQRVGVCEAVAKLNHECVHITNGLDFDELQPTKGESEVRKELGIPEGKKVIGRLGRLGRDKGIEDWLLTCYKLQQMGHEFVPLIVGDEASDCEGYRGLCKLMCDSLPLKNVVWAGHREDTANLYQVMDVFLYPSPTEGFGLVFAEAMYCGATVVTYLTDVTRELFGGYALTSTQEMGIDGLVANVDTILRDPNLTCELTGLAHEWVKSEYQAERMSKEYQELYGKLHKHINGASGSKKEHLVPN